MKLTKLMMVAAGLMFSGLMIHAQTPVNVVNTPTVQDIGTTQPFTYQVNITLPATSANVEGNIAEIPVPSGKRLVIEFISGQAAVQSTTAVTVDLTSWANAATQTTGSSASGIHYLNLVPQVVSPGNSMWTTSQPVKIYSDSSPEFTVGVSSTNGQPLGVSKISLTVSGYLVNL